MIPHPTRHLLGIPIPPGPSSHLSPPPGPMEDLVDPPGWGSPPAEAPSSTRNPDPAREDLTSSTTAPAGGAAGDSQPGISTPEFFKSRSKAYGAIAGAALTAIGGWLNHLAAAHDEDECFLPDDDDLTDIPPPLGRLAARRLRLGNIENLTDIEDLGMAVVGVTAWLAKGVSAAYTARRELKRLTAEPSPAEPGQ
jgi:hypothetical protein